MVPFKRRSTLSIQSRSWKRELVPKDVVNLEYGMELAEFPSTALKFTAHADMPIVLLEDIEYLVDAVICHVTYGVPTAVVELNFRSDNAYTEALNSWSPPFILVTSHLTCNLDDRRGAWLVTGVKGKENYPQIKLTAQSMPLREMGASFLISHSAEGISSAWRQPHALNARIDKVFDFGHVLNLAPRQQLFPLTSGLLDARSTDEVLDVSDAGGVQVFCVNCVSTTNFSVGMELEVTDLGASISAAHINITVLQFEQDIQLEISLDGTASFNQSVDVIRTPLPGLALDVNISVVLPSFSVSIGSIQIPEIGSVGFFFGGAVSASLDVVGGLNFSIGARTSVQPGATATFVMVGDSNSSAAGWDSPTFELIPFRLNSGSLNTTAQLSLSPFLDAEIALLSDDAADARLSIDTPQVTATAAIQANAVNPQCQPIGPNDFTFFSNALTFGAAANLQIQATTNGSILPDTDVSIFSVPVNFAAFPAPDAPDCFIVADDNPADTATLAGEVPSPTGTLLAASSAVPTFDIQKIESFYSAHGALPTNATTIPSNLKSAINGKVNAMPIMYGWI
ncbi:hypothetical protein DFH07DRAFT_963052 [Mycena maculata]|uniref:DUF7029 domain-containing protein n=1 Tax=Mycena maculata TaxID=230809 RepID=A0AAD7N5C6_9AGAR|nr:hypothetical protein DFH07DRAFT_963052 [Mycena maculata]